ncbi:MAG: hypothetical protein RL367_1078 [Pseudomonadota bacterium]
MADSYISVRHMFTMRLNRLHGDSHDFIGPFGRRIFERPRGGTIDGAEIQGEVLDLLATDYGNASNDGTLRHIDANIVAQTHDGVIIHMKVRGRASPAYGPGQSRICLLFTVEPGPYEDLNSIQAVGIGHDEGEDTVYEIYALTGVQESSNAADENLAPAERKTLPATYLFTRKSTHTPGSVRHSIQGPLGGRYMTLAEAGGKFMGPRLEGKFLSGYSWSPHYTGTLRDEEIMHYDVKTLLQTDDGVPILMSYLGTKPTGYTGTYMTATVFETPQGPYDWLNQIQAVGSGRWMGDGAQYTVYALA